MLLIYMLLIYMMLQKHKACFQECTMFIVPCWRRIVDWRKMTEAVQCVRKMLNDRYFICKKKRKRHFIIVLYVHDLNMLELQMFISHTICAKYIKMFGNVQKLGRSRLIQKKVETFVTREINSLWFFFFLNVLLKPHVIESARTQAEIARRYSAIFAFYFMTMVV